MQNLTKDLKSFYHSQHFSDGLRVTIGVLLPALLFSAMGQLMTGVTVALGAIGVSLADTPGPVVHKRNGMMVAIVVCGAAALLTGFARLHVVTLGLEILVLSFLSSMLVVYGLRASLIGLAALLVLILTMDRELEPLQILVYSGYVLLGGGWYLLLSLVSYQVFPYRAAQQALGECVLEVAKFLRFKASFYKQSPNWEMQYRQLVNQQILVSEKMDAMRELLFKTRQIMQESTPKGRALVLTFIDLVDLYEQITAIQYDYATMHDTFGQTGILEKIADQVKAQAQELETIGLAAQANALPKTAQDQVKQLEELKLAIDALGQIQPDRSTLVLKKVVVNLRAIGQRLNIMRTYFTEQTSPQVLKERLLDVNLFVNRQNLSPRLFLDNLTFTSSAFRFSVRVALVATFAFVLMQVFPYGQHSYWVLLTVIVLLKPAYSLTKKRNVERLLGTVIGAALGLLVLFLVENHTLQFVFLVLFMTGFYMVQRINYMLSVILMTPFMLILFSFLGGGGLIIVQERMVDTVIGCAIAFSATYFLFPNWESKQINQFLQKALLANLKYLQVLAKSLAGNTVTPLEYKLSRKHVYVHAANLSAAFQRMTGEPKSKQQNSGLVHELVVLNHVMSSYIATLVSERMEQANLLISENFLKTCRRAQGSLVEALKKLEAPANDLDLESVTVANPKPAAAPTSEEEQLLTDQLEFIRKVCADIQRLTESMAAPKAS
ncbi:FUSC family membrane protein [Rufibacter sp. LB8]|uniref:FUSC family membrane protein n=1 Tax=Rufibacter sp. LB8 TaxID=2777781 RepID=UPI00178C4C32|nr:FUSC family membrane protein [Rufibacter sp. LB8]